MTEASLTIQNRVLVLYLLTLIAHVGHMSEEFWGYRFLIDVFYRLDWFMSVNWLLFCVPVCLLYYVIRGKHWAFSLSILSAGIMILMEQNTISQR